MLKALGFFKTNEDSTVYYGDQHFLFFKPYLSAPGITNTEVVIYKDPTLTVEVGRFYLPTYTSVDISGGLGITEYDKLIDKLEDLTIDILTELNEDLFIEKYIKDEEV